MSMNVCPDSILRTAGPFTTKLGMMTHRHGPNRLPKSLGMQVVGVGVFCRARRETLFSLG